MKCSGNTILLAQDLNSSCRYSPFCCGFFYRNVFHTHHLMRNSDFCIRIEKLILYCNRIGEQSQRKAVGSWRQFKYLKCILQDIWATLLGKQCRKRYLRFCGLLGISPNPLRSHFVWLRVSAKRLGCFRHNIRKTKKTGAGHR